MSSLPGLFIVAGPLRLNDYYCLRRVGIIGPRGSADANKEKLAMFISVRHAGAVGYAIRCCLVVELLVHPKSQLTWPTMTLCASLLDSTLCIILGPVFGSFTSLGMPYEQDISTAIRNAEAATLCMHTNT